MFTLFSDNIVVAQKSDGACGFITAVIVRDNLTHFRCSSPWFRCRRIFDTFRQLCDRAFSCPRLAAVKFMADKMATASKGCIASWIQAIIGDNLIAFGAFGFNFQVLSTHVWCKAEAPLQTSGCHPLLPAGGHFHARLACLQGYHTEALL